MRSAKFTDQPQYSAMVAGTNSDASATSPAHTTPSTSADGDPGVGERVGGQPGPLLEGQRGRAGELPLRRPLGDADDARVPPEAHVTRGIVR